MSLRLRREPPEPADDDEYERPRRRWPTAVILIVAIAFIGTATTAGVRVLQNEHSSVGQAPSVPPALRAPSTSRPFVQILADPAVLGDPSSQWWARLASASPVELRVDAVRDGRYAGAANGSFGAAANRVAGGARLVILLGDSGDGGASSVAIAAGATRALAQARLLAPNSELVVVGPDGMGGDVLRVQGALRAAARIAGATWVDSNDLERAGAIKPPVSSSAVARTRLVDGISGLIESSLDVR